MSKQFTRLEVLSKLPEETYKALIGCGEADLSDPAIHVALIEAVLSFAGVPFTLSTVEIAGAVDFCFKVPARRNSPGSHSPASPAGKERTR